LPRFELICVFSADFNTSSESKKITEILSVKTALIHAGQMDGRTNMVEEALFATIRTRLETYANNNAATQNNMFLTL
jgi:hypothetical protein